MSLADAIDAVVADTDVVAEIRADPVIDNLLKAYKKTPYSRIDSGQTLAELSELSASVAFDAKGFPLNGTRGLKNARDARLELQAARDRLVAMERQFRQGMAQAAKVLRVGMVYIRQSGTFKGMTAKHMDQVAEVALREIVENQETLKLLSIEVREALTSVDGKSKVLDSWFNLHKQYVFMTGTSRGPRGEQETHDQASKQQGSGRLGRRRDRDEDEE